MPAEFAVPTSWSSNVESLNVSGELCGEFELICQQYPHFPQSTDTTATTTACQDLVTQAIYHNLAPIQLQADLVAVGTSPNLSTAISEIYASHKSATTNRANDASGQSATALTSINCTTCVRCASSDNAAERVPHSVVTMNVKERKNGEESTVAYDLEKNEMMNLFNTFEEIQGQLNKMMK